MIRFLTLLVGTFLLWTSPLNSGNTNKIWVPATYEEAHYKELRFPHNITFEASMLMDPQELECMSKNIYFEAAVESTAGKLAVAQVTLNRVKSQYYPNTVCSVVYQGKHHQNGFPKRDQCQFSWYCDGKHDVPSKGKMWRESRDIAIYALTNVEMLDITDGATHYHADYIPEPRWATQRDRTMQIDTHIFYNKHKSKNFTF